MPGAAQTTSVRRVVCVHLPQERFPPCRVGLLLDHGLQAFEIVAAHEDIHQFGEIQETVMRAGLHPVLVEPFPGLVRQHLTGLVIDPVEALQQTQKRFRRSVRGIDRIANEFLRFAGDLQRPAGGRNNDRRSGGKRSDNRRPDKKKDNGFDPSKLRNSGFRIKEKK